MISLLMIVNTSSPSVYFFEPSPDEKRKRSAALYGLKKVRRMEIEELKAELKSIRARAKENIGSNLESFKESLRGIPWLNLHEVDSPKDFLKIFRKHVPKKYPVSLNKSNIAVNELRPLLRKAGYRSYIRYFAEFENLSDEKRVFKDYYMLPGLHERNLIETFEVKHTHDLIRAHSLREYAAVLSVNAADSENGNLYFLQHMSNISKDISEAKILFLIVGVEKIVEKRTEAEKQVMSVGVFGLESVILDLKPKPEEVFDFEGLGFSDGKREIHVILLDNGRKRLLSTQYEELLLCIDCRACARQCPVGEHLQKYRNFVYSPKNMLLLSLQGKIKPFEFCLHCGRCEIECPVGIRLPELIWRSQVEYYGKRAKGLKRIAFDNPEMLARVGSMLSPFSNFSLRIPILRIFLQIFPGIHRKANLPKFHRETFRDWLNARRSS